ncbi:MAG: sensor histidine kinase [Epulopiscium sp.]|nr:sensor histidine kinase [Candidatus Epulonipiscium sp.]
MKRKISDFYYSISMKKKWVVFICVILLYEIILIGFVGYRNYEEIIGDHFIEGVKTDINNVTEQIESNLIGLEEFARKLQYDEYINSFIQEREYSSKVQATKSDLYEYKVIPDYQFKRSVEKHLNSIVLSRPEIQLASIRFEKDINNTYVVSRTKSYAEELTFQKKDIFDKELEGESNTLYYMDDDNNLYIIQNLKSRVTLNQVATVIIKLDSELVLQKIYDMIEGAKEGAYLVGFNDREILQLGEITAEQKNEVISNFRLGDLSKDYLGDNPKKDIIVYDTINTTSQQMGVGVVISKDILFQDIRASSLKILVFSILTIPIFLLLAYKLYKDIIQPIYELSDKMRRIENGEMGVLVDSGRKDEIGVLFRAFNKMSNQINFLVNRVYKEQLALKNSEIRALQAQINPHFLYNTLETINWTARLSGADEVADMLEALGGIMEVNIDRKDERFLTVEEELKYTNHYIFLIKKRFGDNVKFEQDIDEKIMKYKVPRLILQPIIENAIEHGIEPVGSGFVIIRMFIKDDMLIIEVEDSGQGIQADMVLEMEYNLGNWDSLASEKVESTSQGKIGVLNVHSRLRLIYGEESGIEIVSIYGKGTLIRMKVPIKEEE